MTLVWECVKGRAVVGPYWRAKTPDGYIRIQRINKTGVPLFRLRWPDGMNITLGSEEAAKGQAEAVHARKTAS